MSREFKVGTGSIEWVVTGYLLSLAVWIPASGWIGDRIGTKRVFLTAIAIFTIASMLCGIATSLNELIAFRILQGVGGGILTPVGFAMLMRAFPPSRRAQASKILILPTAVAPASGPIIGGLLVDWLSWRWVFFINLPICLATLIFGAIFLKEHREPRKGGFDIAGFVLSGGGLALILFGLGKGPGEGWGSPVVLVPGILGVAAFALLVVVELRREFPMLQLRLIRNRMFRSSMVTSAFSVGAFLGLLFVMPLFLQIVRGASAFESGLTTFPEALGVMAGSQVVGKFYPTLGPRRPMAAGLLCMSGFLVLLTTIDLDTSLWTIRLLMFAMGASMSFVFMPMQAASMASISAAETGQASAISNTQRQMASALAVAVLATVLSTRLPDAVGRGGPLQFANQQVSAFHTVFLVGAGMALAGAFTALLIRDSDAAATMRSRHVVAPVAVAAPAPAPD